MEKKNKKILGKVIAIVFLIILIIAITYYAILKQEQARVEQKISDVFNALKSGDEDAKNEYLAYNEMLENQYSTEENITKEDDTQFNILFSKLEYKIVSINTNFKKATVILEITNKDAGTIFTNYFTKAIQLAFASAFTNQYSEEELDSQLQQYLVEQVESDDVQLITNTISLDMEKKDGEWKIITDSTVLANAVLPGFMDKVNETKSTLSGEE